MRGYFKRLLQNYSNFVAKKANKKCNLVTLLYKQ